MAASLPCPCAPALSLAVDITTENPAYIQGDFNANSAGGGFCERQLATSVAADAITILSVNWNDAIPSLPRSITPLRVTGPRPTSDTAVLAGKEVSFQIPAWEPSGSMAARTSVRMVVSTIPALPGKWNGTLFFYEGSIVSLFYSRQATGLFQFRWNNYSPPTALPVRCELPESYALAAADTDVPRHQHDRIYAASSATQ